MFPFCEMYLSVRTSVSSTFFLSFLVVPGALTLVVDHQSDKSREQNRQEAETLCLLDDAFEKSPDDSVGLNWSILGIGQGRREAGVGSHGIRLSCAEFTTR